MSARADAQRMIQENQPDNHSFSRNSSSPRSFGGYGSYDRYVPPRPSTSYRDDYAYRASSWRPNERQTSYYNRSPSPTRHDSSRPLDDPWTRSPAEPSGWQDRRPSELWGVNRRREPGAERSFEPSEAWKQTHDSRPHQDTSPPQFGDRYLPTYSRESRDHNQMPRSHGPDHYSPPSSGDHYRPYSDPYGSRDLFPNSRADSYRPQYQEDGWNYSYSSVSRNPRARTPDDMESPRKDPRPGYVHRLPVSHTDRKSRHYSPARPSNDMFSHGRKSPSPTSLRFNHPRNIEYTNRAHSRSPGTSFNHEHSPPIPGLLHDTQQISGIEIPFRPNFRAGTPSKRRSPSLPIDELPLTKKPRSISLERQSSIASSRRSSPEPMLVVERRFTVQPTKEPTPTGLSSLTPSNHSLIQVQAETEMASGLSQQTFQRLSVTTPPQVTAQQGAQSALGHAEQLHATIGRQVPHHLDPPSATPDKLPCQPSSGHTIPMNAESSYPTSPNLAVIKKSSEILQSSSVRSPGLVQKILVPEGSHRGQVLAVDEVPPQSGEDIRPEVIHHSTSYDTKSMTEALKHAVMSRYLHDPHRRNERVEPILLSNLSIAERHVTNPVGSDSLMQEVVGGSRMKSRQEKFREVIPPLSAVLAHRQSFLSEKIQRLKSEYLELHHNWLEQCAKLDDAAKSLAGDDTVTATGRTTRRSAASLGDAVRSDLEMEQIIASLGNEDLTDANHLAMRNAAVVPDMISVTHGQVDYFYDDTNNLIEEAADFYAQRTGIDDWADEEKQIFVEQYAAYPKQFGIIAEALPSKTAAQCVSFYYLHKKKHIDFRKVVQRYAPNKRRRGGRKTDKQRGNALLADIRKHDAEVSSKDTEPQDPGLPKKRKPGRPPNIRKSQIELTPGTTPTPTATPDPEFIPRSRGGRKLHMRVPPIIEDLTEEEEEPKPVKKPGRRGRKPKMLKPASSEEPVPASDSQDTNGRRKTNQSAVQWSEDDQNIFIELVAQHGDNFKRIAASMPNKTTVQVSVFYNTNLKKLDLDKVAATAPRRTPSPLQSPPDSHSSQLPSESHSKDLMSREHEPGPKICASLGRSSPSPPSPSFTVLSFDPNRIDYTSSDHDLVVPLTREGSCRSPSSFQTVFAEPSLENIPTQNYVQSLAAPQHEPYFPSHRLPYSRPHPSVIIIPESELPLATSPSGSAANQGETFYINDYHHSRVPHQTQSSSMTVIPGLVDINVPDFDPQYHQPVIRVQQQDSHTEPPTSTFMTGRVLLSTKAYSGGS